jgi:hypothetical protein
VSIIDRAKEKVRDPRVIPPDVDVRLRRGRKKMREDWYKRELCRLFLRGESYHFLNDKGAMRSLETNQGLGAGRPSHRVRSKLNMIRPMVDAKVSSSTTRVPGYEINPSSTDPEDDSAARLSSKLARQGFERWYLRQARVKAVTVAIGEGGKAFALPYFDPMVGPYRLIEDEDGKTELVGEGEIKVLILNGNECYGEPGVEFYHSRWYVVEHARPISEVQQWPGYMGGNLSSDASTTDAPGDEPDEGMVMVTMYFERPCPKYPQGRMLTMAGGKQVMPEGPYPLRSQGKVLDEPCIYQLVYRLSSDGDDLGLTYELIDFQTSYQDAMNKSVEIKNHALLPQLMAPRGSITEAPSDMPGEIIYYNGSVDPKWRPAPDPGILSQLQAIAQRCLDDMRFAASDTDVQAAPNVATGSINAVIQQAANRWSQFLGEVAEWDSKVMRRCLMLCQEHYTEERILKVRGRFGWEPQATFRGADIMGQVDVTVNPASIETQSRAAQLQTLSWVQANFPGYVRPEVAIEIALHGVPIESVIEPFEFDKARANEIIQKVLDGSIMDMPTRTETDPRTGMPMVEPVMDEATGQPVMVPGPDGITPVAMMQLKRIPGWMPRPFDNAEVQMWVFAQWLKTPDAGKLPPDMYAAAMHIYDAFKMLLDTQQAQAMAAQTAMAEEAGAKNAAKPTEAKVMPSTPAPGEPQ